MFKGSTSSKSRDSAKNSDVAAAELTNPDIEDKRTENTSLSAPPSMSLSVSASGNLKNGLRSQILRLTSIPQRSREDVAILRAINSLEESLGDKHRNLLPELCTSLVSLNAGLRAIRGSKLELGSSHLLRSRNSLDEMQSLSEEDPLQQVLRWIRGSLDALDDHLLCEQTGTANQLPFDPLSIASNCLLQASTLILRYSSK